MKWLMGFVVQCYEVAPDDLNVRLPVCPKNVIFYRMKAEADELQSFVGKKKNKQWLWLAIDSHTRQALAFHVGDRSKKSARKLWKKLPAVYRQHATFWTDGYASYQGIIPATQHRIVTKASRGTNHIERLNCTLRQRVSRLVRATLSFSKKLTNHIGAIKYLSIFMSRGFPKICIWQCLRIFKGWLPRDTPQLRPWRSPAMWPAS
jgi:insertion element IS1 protein InsB